MQEKIIRPAKDLYKSVPGWCSDIEAAALQQFSGGKKVLEIGVWKGRSTIAMAAVAYHVLSIDHFIGDNFAGPSNPRQETITRLTSYQSIVSLCVGDWVRIVEYIDLSKFDMIYYDADHTYEATKQFLDIIHGFKGVIALHDVDNNPNHAGVKQALHEYTTDYTLYDRLAIIS
jgi:predicted O-methyltransferase YrrM